MKEDPVSYHDTTFNPRLSEHQEKSNYIKNVEKDMMEL